MDVNGTRHCLLLGRADWARCRDVTDASTYDAAREAVTLRGRLPEIGGGAVLDPRARRGVAVGPYEAVFFIATDDTRIAVQRDGAVLEYSGAPAEDDLASSPFRPVEPRPSTARRLSGLAVTATRRLVVGARDPGALLVFDLDSTGAPRELRLPASVPFEPFDLAAAADGGVLVLDRTHRMVWSFDSRFRVRNSAPLPAPASVFAARDGSRESEPALEDPRGLSLAAHADPPIDPFAIAALPDGSFLVLDRGDATHAGSLRRWGDSGPIGAPWSLSELASVFERSLSPSESWVGHAIACIADVSAAGAVSGEVLLTIASRPRQAFAIRVTGDASQTTFAPSVDVFALRLHHGRGLVADPVRRRFLYDGIDAWFPLLSTRQRAYVEAATLITPILDSHREGCVWHRLELEASVPSGTALVIASRSAETPAELEQAPFVAEPTLVRRRTSVARDEGAPATRELLLQRARGRLLQLRIELEGDRRSTPRIHALRASYPRPSWVERYLPPTYEQHDEGHFLERFLANPEGILTDVEGRIAGAYRFFDPALAPDDALSWLASWFGIALDAAWEPARRRVFVRNALRLFAARGTARGIRWSLELSLCAHPSDAIFSEVAESAFAPIRIVERTDVASLPALRGSEGEGLARAASAGRRWSPSDGAAALHARWATARGESSAEFPLRAPAADAHAWKQFASGALGFVPRTSASEAGSLRAFLRRRYPNIEALNAAWRSTHTSFDVVRPWERLPVAAAELHDWFVFESAVLRAHDHAHRLAVLLPIKPADLADPAALERQRTTALRVLQANAPAHVAFAVDFYWAMFRVGTARVGLDTTIHLGSRRPDLAPPFVAGRARLAAGHLAQNPPRDVRDRWLVGRDPESLRPLA